MISYLLGNSVSKVDLADASESKCDIPDGLHDFLWKTIEEVREKPFEDPDLVRYTHF